LQPKLGGSNPEEDDGFLKVIKILSTPSFGGEVKLSDPCRKIKGHVKISSNYEQGYFVRPNS
jgi:hypothetical protein